MSLILENLIKARDCAQMAREDLVEANKGATALQSLAIMPRINDAAVLVAAIEGIIVAMESDAN